MLAECEAGLTSILEGKDRHQLTAEVMFDIIKEEVDVEEWKEYRQQAKASTFSPLFGGGNASEKLKQYKEAFFKEHIGISKWHDKLCSEALQYKQLVCPDGMIFAFPNAKRQSADRVTGKTQIVNYPVQHFATFTIAWVVILELRRLLKLHNLRSCIVLQVHDSVTVDTHPEEIEQVQELVKKAFSSTHQLLTNRFNYVTNVPIGFEMSIGKNLLEKEVVYASK
jgi:DNA polymerase I-like protein with 3'-5' exonuclease and polymerase domains